MTRFSGSLLKNWPQHPQSSIYRPFGVGERNSLVEGELKGVAKRKEVWW